MYDCAYRENGKQGYFAPNTVTWSGYEYNYGRHPMWVEPQDSHVCTVKLSSRPSNS